MNKKQAPRGFFDEQDILAKLSRLNDPLEKLNDCIDFEIFRETLNGIYKKSQPKSNAGAKPYDYVLMFKILILQRLYNLSDEQIEFQLNDRMSFRRFTGLEFSHRVPDYNTIWNFKQSLAKEDNERKLFDRFYAVLEQKEMVINEGKMVDASFHEVPRQRNSREENQKIKEGGIPDSFKENPNKGAHKDTDARWTKKNNETFYGYKNHIKADAGSKFIDDYTVTSANIHDSQGLEQLLDEKDKGQALYADSAYSGEDIEGMVSKTEMINQINEKGYRNNPLTETQKESNRKKSKVRARVEHIFGFVGNTMKGTLIRTIGMARAKMNIGLTNLTYNICQAVQLKINMYAVG
ncbi:MAG: IS5 family transposase [Chlamydiota bacterium]|nr:IS5 family transposase [Chlamydiota bacterium]